MAKTIPEDEMEKAREIARKALEGPQKIPRREDSPLRYEQFTFNEDAKKDGP